MNSRWTALLPFVVLVLLSLGQVSHAHASGGQVVTLSWLYQMGRKQG